MGPTNTALVHLFKTDQALRHAQERLDAASKNVRVQDRRVADLAEKHKAAHAKLREHQSRAGQLDLELKSRDAHIERLRSQQQTARNNKEYQAFLVEINTHKVDRGKVEDEAVKAMEQTEKLQAEVAVLAQQLETEKAKLATITAQIGDELARLTAEVDALRPAREAAAAAVSPRARAEFERLAERFEGEALSPIAKPDRRREEYLCTACNLELVPDVYNRLRTRDDLVFCPSCRRMLYIPEDMTAEMALGTGKPTPRPVAVKRTRTAAAAKPSKGAAAAAAPGVELATAGDESAGDEVVIEKRAKGRLGDALAKAQGETVRSAKAGGYQPVECEVYVDGELAGIYKGSSPEQLERYARHYMAEAGLTVAEVRVTPVAAAEPEAEGEAAPPPPDSSPVSTGSASSADAAAPQSSLVAAAPESPGGVAAAETTAAVAGAAAENDQPGTRDPGPAPTADADEPQAHTTPAGPNS